MMNKNSMKFALLIGIFTWCPLLSFASKDPKLIEPTKIVPPKTEQKVIVTRLESDGPNQGFSAYDLIRQFGGPRPIEAPDLYQGNHTDVEHIFEDHDSVVGNHFVFTIHRDLDKDRNKFEKFGDRQRNEIKAYAKSSDQLKGFEGQTLRYTWKFKIDEGMTVSKNFTHLFQLKSVDDGIGTPILTISGANRRGEDLMILAHMPVRKPNYLATIPWENAMGKWLEVDCLVRYANDGMLSLSVKEHLSQKVLYQYQADNVDMWRGTQAHHFVRPKWGIYRSLKSKHMLRPDEERVRFADFEVTKYTSTTKPQS